jgi:mono/diheme cytochrome c family protein
MNDREPFHDPPEGDSTPLYPENEIDLAKVHGSILREHKEPAEGYESVPLWLMTIVMLLVFWGGGYLAFFSGGFRADAFVPRKGMAGPAVDLNDPATLGQRIYTQNCILCHQANGAGIPRIYPPLAGSEWALAKDWRGDNHLVSIVLHGLQGPVEVGGATFNGAMPGWKALRDDEVAAVLTYVRSQWGNTEAPIPADFVRQIREETATRNAVWSQGELQGVAREAAPAATGTPKPRLKAMQ